MNRNLRVLVLLVLLIIIPFLVYAFLQLSSLKEDEQMADEIYEKQMDAVLFSLNQYADDMTSQWIRQLQEDESDLNEEAADLVLRNESIQLLVIRNMETNEDSLFFGEYAIQDQVDRNLINQWYSNQDSVMRRLETYLDAGFQKIQSVADWQLIAGLRPSQAATSIMLYNQDSVLYNALIILESNFWAEQILGARMVELARDNFKMAVIQGAIDAEPNILYSTDAINFEGNYFQRPLWVLPDTYLIIRPQGESYSDLIRSRNKKNFYFLIFSVVIVLAGGLLIIRNIRNTFKIAQLKSDFVSNVSHEIRTPVSLIKMYAETLMLGRVKSDEKKQHYYNVMHHESGRLTYLVNNILDFSRIEANRKTYAKEPANLNQLVQQVYANYEYTFKEKGVSASLALAQEEILVELDTSAFDEALSNLIDNAIKYSEANPKVEIKSGMKDGFGYCTVQDHGKGISKPEQSRIFDKFYRVEGAMTQKTKGTGLGLSLVKHIMDAHKGVVEVSSRPGEGSIFTLKFPLMNS